VHQGGVVHGGFGPEDVILSADGPRIIEFGITPPYGSATPSADMLAWARTMVFAATGRPPSRLEDLDVLPYPLRDVVADCLAGDPALRPTARTVVLDLLDDVEPPTGALAEGARRAAEATYTARAALADPLDASRPGDRAGSRSAGHGRRHAGGHAPRNPARSSARSRSNVLPIGAAALVIAAVAFVIVHLMQSTGPDPAATGAAALSSPPSSSTSPVSSTATAAPSGGPTAVAAAFAGQWSGQARQVNPDATFSVRLSLPSGSAEGTIVYSGQAVHCTGGLSLQAATPDTVRLGQTIAAGHCAQGVVTLTTGPHGDLKFSFRGSSGSAVSGTLDRT
jgi:hypothetical protein